MKIVAFVPIRLNSKRVAGKNLKLLGNKPLMSYILKTLVNVKQIAEVYVYCSTEDIKQYLPEGVKFLKRNKKFDSDETLGAEIYEAFINEIDADIYILAHTTSPFVKSTTIEKAIEQMQTGEYDSALTVEKLQTFAWYDNKPINYSLNLIPRTQDIKPVFIETSAFFMFTKALWKEKKQRIGSNPYFAIVNKIEGLDIDTPQDFEFATKIIDTYPNYGDREE